MAKADEAITFMRDISSSSTCIKCNKYYDLPHTAGCGHSLCHKCWRGLNSCLRCKAPVDLNNLTPNREQERRTIHARTLVDIFENLYKIKVVNEAIVSNDPVKAVKDWLTSSQNQFSGPFDQTQVESQAPVCPLSVKVLVHQLSQEDWDKIEVLGDSETVCKKDKENVDEQMDIETLALDDDNHNNKPRRSLRNKGTEKGGGGGTLEKKPVLTSNVLHDPLTTHALVDCTNINNNKACATDIIVDNKAASDISKHGWVNAKKMRKEFSKLNRRNVKKLNVSIEMCKKSQSVISRANAVSETTNCINTPYTIDDSTPAMLDSPDEGNVVHEKEIAGVTASDQQKQPIISTNLETSDPDSPLAHFIKSPDGARTLDRLKSVVERFEGTCTQLTEISTDLGEGLGDRLGSQTVLMKKALTNKSVDDSLHKNIDVDESRPKVQTLEVNACQIARPLPQKPFNSNTTSRVNFLKKGKLFQKSINVNHRVPFYYRSRCQPKNNTNSDNINIAITAGDTITNIVIANKQNGFNVTKIYSEKGAQTSPEYNNKPNTQAKSRLENLLPNNERSKLHKQISQANNLDKFEKILNKDQNERSECVKKHTASEDTATCQFKITESVEKEMSKDMDCANDLDIFNSGSVVGANVHNLRESNKSVSEIIECTTKIKKKQTQPSQNVLSAHLRNKRDFQQLNSNSSKPSKKLKADAERQEKVFQKQPFPDTQPSQIINVSFRSYPQEDSIREVTAVQNEPCDSMNYDEIMSQVLANIDADMNEHDTKKAHPKPWIQGEDMTQSAKLTERNVAEVANVESAKVRTLMEKQKSDQKTSLRKNEHFKTKEQTSQGPHCRTPQDLKSLKERSINPTFDMRDEEAANKFSENVFSLFERNSQKSDKDSEMKDKVAAVFTTQENVANLLTPGMCQNFAAPTNNLEAELEAETVLPQATPDMDIEEIFESDSSIVEETPQKTKKLSSCSTNKSKNQKSVTNKELTSIPKAPHTAVKMTILKPLESQEIRSIINLTDSTQIHPTDSEKINSEDVNVMVEQLSAKRKSMETPSTLNRFADQIKHKSTPMHSVARKSLNFTNKDEEPNMSNVTLCPETADTPAPTKTTLEQEFLCKAFDKSPHILPLRRQLSSRKDAVKLGSNKNIFIACSCLQSVEVSNVKILAMRNKWTYLEKYTSALTHLIAGVDEDNRSQRSVKYMCALAAGKWILSYKWVSHCLKENGCVDEIPYEVLDSTGDSGPQLSRTAISKLFQGITFFCCPPFTVLPKELLEDMLVAAGGRVVHSLASVSQPTPTDVALLLGEPDHTQDERFMYIVMEHKLVAVNYEWVLNCLGCYSLLSLRDQLLCPPSLMPLHRLRWPLLLDSSEDTPATAHSSQGLL